MSAGPPLGERAGPPLGEIASRAGLRRIAVVAWRDLDDPEAGGSEMHAHEVIRRWAAAGIDVVLRTSAVAGEPAEVRRDGYLALRRAGRYQVFAAAASDLVRGRLGPIDGVVEIWNGMPFFTPLWASWGGRRARAVWVHHVHAEMWRMVLPPRLAALGETVETRLAPPFYRRSRIVTLSESSRAEIVEMLGMRPERVSVVVPGVDPFFSPGGALSPHPLVVAVGRLVPVKRFDRLIGVIASLRERIPGVECVIVGEGSERPSLESLRHRLGADGFVHLPGHLPPEELRASYRQAWALAATSVREGWGMTVSEAAACGTPAVVTRIAGHADAVVEGESGFLAASDEELVAKLEQVLSGEALRERLSKGALHRASALCWDATAAGALAVLADEAERRLAGGADRRRSRWPTDRR